MCGIAGVILGDGLRARAAVERINVVQHHRGPDDTGLVVSPFGERTLVLGHTRLSILDLSAAGRQPMLDPETGNLIVYNGEIYNYREIRDELRSAGSRFRTETDTEVVLAGFARWGIGVLPKLSGMYALAIYAPATRCLYLARDPLGIKPLYYSLTPNLCVFASELKAVAATGLVGTEHDPVALASLLAYGAVPGPHTMLRGVRQLDPGAWLAVRPELANGPERRYHWSYPAIAEPPVGTRFTTELETRLVAAVKGQLQSDVPVGVFLSGGLDSAVVTAIASELRNGDIDAFTVSVGAQDTDHRRLDESDVASETARRLRVRHHLVHVSHGDAASMALGWLQSMDQPTVDGLNTYVISQAVRQQGIKVTLSGLGADEVFGGYPTFREAPLYGPAMRTLAYLPSQTRAQLALRLGGKLSVARRQKLADLARGRADVTSFCLGRRRLLCDGELRTLGLSDLGLETWIPTDSEVKRGVDEHDPWSAVRALEMRFYMGNMLLRDTDVFGMAHGLEIRVPFLDQRVVDFALRLTKPGWAAFAEPPKSWLWSAMKSRIPAHLRGLSKRGFSLPYATWASGALRAELEGRIEALAGSGLVDGPTVMGIWRSFVARPAEGAWWKPWILAAVGNWLLQKPSQTELPS